MLRSLGLSTLLLLLPVGAWSPNVPRSTPQEIKDSDSNKEVAKPSEKGIAELEKRLETASPREKLAILIRLINRQTFIITDLEKSYRYSKMAVELARELGEPYAESKALQGLAFYQFRKGNIQQSMRYYFQAREVGGIIGDQLFVAIMNCEIGNLFHYCLSDWKNALVYYDKSLMESVAIGNPYLQMKNINLMGEVYRKMGRYEEAVEAYISALEKSEADDFPLARRKQAVILVNLSEMYGLLGHYDWSRDKLDKAEAIYRQENLTQEIGGVLTVRGNIFRSEGRYDEALECYRRALEIHRQNLDPIYSGVDIHKVAEVLSLSGRTVEANKEFELALQKRREIGDFPGTAQTLLAMGVHYRRSGHAGRALPYTLESLKIAQQKDLPGEQMEAYRELADFMAAKGDQAEELRYLKLYERVRERILSPKTTTKMIDTIKEYEKREAVKQANEKKWRTLKYGMAILGLLILAFFFYFLYARRSKEWAARTIAIKEHQLVEQQSQLDLLKARLRELETPVGRVKYQGSKLSPELEQVYLQKLIVAMEKDKLYLNPELTLDDLAAKFNINRSYLSQAINHSTGKKFLEFINSFRIDEAKRLIAAGDAQDLSILDISLEAGFNSKAVFNRIFKKLTGMTPGEYRSAKASHPPAAE